MDFKKAPIGNTIYEVVSPNGFNPEIFSYGEVAVQHNGMLYPYENSKTYTGPTTEMIGDGIMMFNTPEQGSYDPMMYSDTKVIDFGNTKSYQELINASESIRKIENEILISTDNVYVLPIREKDTPEMVGLKEAINDKHIDIEKYQPRFGSNYGNDRRLLENSPSITFPKLTTMMNIFDLKGTLILEDKDPNVPNPINKKIIIELE